MNLASVFGNNMVLQQGSPVPVWGTAKPLSTVTVRFADHEVSAKADQQGRWKLSLPLLPASHQPRTMEVKSSDGQAISLSNVLVGEVWICSGQSNMEWRLSQAKNAEAEIATAQYPDIRLMNVPQRPAEEPLGDFPGLAWEVCTPESAQQFSAVGYFFGRELHQHLRVPIGLINSSWGGTVAEAWTSRDGLLHEPALRQMVEDFERERPIYKQRHDEWQAVMDAHEAKTRDVENAGFARGWAAVGEPAGEWKDIDGPGYWQSRGYNFSGILWYRKVVDVPAAWAGKELSLSIGATDKSDVTYFNGQKVGSVTMEDRLDAWSLLRTYKVSGALVKAGRNVIAVRVRSNKFAGGMTGPGDVMRLTCPSLPQDPAIPLGGTWRVAVEKNYGLVELPKEPVGPGNPNTPSTLYNGMIAPLVPFIVRGAIWYQGESNADRARQYRTLFKALIGDWRRLWDNKDLGFYFVQLANFMGQTLEPANSDWADLREAQTMALSLGQTGMAVAIDIGDADDIHPKNKQDVGKRLAMSALHTTYGQKDVVPSGPLFRWAKREGNAMRISFDYAQGLTARGGKVTGFAIAGADGKFVWADARIEKDSVLVSSDAVSQPVAVRYAWADNPQCNLYNAANLPASPFRTDMSS